MTKRFILYCLIVILGCNIKANAQQFKGRLNSTITWEIKDNTLSIKGRGSMRPASSNAIAPWLELCVSRRGNGAPKVDLAKIIVGEGITEIWGFDFSSDYYEFHPASVRVELPKSLRAIAPYTFSGTNIYSIHIPDGVTKIGESAFKGCKTLTTIILPNSLKTIENYMFNGCNNLKYCYIPESVTKIERYAFSGCYNLIFNVPISVKNIEEGAFQGISDRRSTTPLEKRSLTLPNGYRNSDTAPLDFSTLDQWMIHMEPLLTDYVQPLLCTKPFPADSVRNIILTKVSKWEQKDEFETTAEWNARVTESTRQAYLDKTVAEITAQANKQNQLYATEFAKGQAYYDKLCNAVRDRYYYARSVAFNQKLKNAAFQLKPYDADHESFLITSTSTGDILLPVPRAQAAGFKERWATIAKTISGRYVPSGNTVALSRIVFKDGANQYTYDSNTEAVYAQTEITHKFKPVEIGDLSVESLNLTLAQPIAQSTTNKTVATKTTRSDVDKDIPEGTHPHTNMFAVVIANEHYRHAENVPFAENDDKIMCEYLKTTLKVPEKQILHLNDATLNDMNYAISQLRQYDQAFGPDLEVLVYYAGHGVPDEATRDSYLLPSDGHGTSMSTAFKLGDLYATLSSVQAKSVTVFIDACFSGTIRSGEMLHSARGVARAPKPNTPKGNMVVFSAAQGTETAAPYNEKQHGLFTYFLLKKIKDSAGNVTLGELGQYIIDNVTKSSVIENGKIQTPAINCSAALTNSWHLKNL